MTTVTRLLATICLSYLLSAFDGKMAVDGTCWAVKDWRSIPRSVQYAQASFMHGMAELQGVESVMCENSRARLVNVRPVVQ